jgi:hypothetical protein
VSGGVNSTDCDGTLNAEIFGFDLGTGIWPGWFIGDEAKRARNYHSVALLLRDGRIWTAGGNKNANATDCAPEGGCDSGGTCGNGLPDNRQLSVEIFNPWYYGRSDRPVISSCPASINTAGGTYTINLSSGDGGSITKVALMRPGSVTHSFDTDQRLIWLDVGAKTSSTVQFKSPYTPYVAPPGDYMLFVLSNKLSYPLIPSVGCWTKTF